ncbi:hypothetical protein WMY93_018131 [Mugilogobius chulae]|uniref:Graves disease carrier protein n=1 Tax=Mugilogobius chulae TaxID=88201 RepID=A0AAW0NMW1_9GOBI
MDHKPRHTKDPVKGKREQTYHHNYELKESNPHLEKRPSVSHGQALISQDDIGGFGLLSSCHKSSFCPKRLHFLRSFVAGGVAGCCAKTTIAPLDRVKILLQAQNPHYKHLGMTAVVFTYPLDVVRARLAFQVKGEHRYTGIINAFQTIYLKEGGILGFYRGLTPTIIGMAPYSGFSFFTFGTLKSLGLKHFPDRLGTPSLDNPNVLVLKAHVNMVCGGVAGAIAQTISYPLDVARRRMQLGVVLPDSDKCVSLTKTLKYVYTTYGIKRGLYRGLSLNYIRCVPSQAVAFTVYEFMKQVLYLN